MEQIQKQVMRTWMYGGALKPRDPIKGNVLIFFPKQKTRRKKDDSVNEIKHISDGACSSLNYFRTGYVCPRRQEWHW